MKKNIFIICLLAATIPLFSAFTLLGQTPCDTPTNPVITGDLTICEGSDAVLNATTDATLVKWYSSATSTTPIHVGAEIVLQNLVENTNVWAQGVNPDLEGTHYTGGARLNPGTYTGGAAVSPASSPWGLRFNISKDIVLNSVDVFILAETPSVLIIQLKDAQYNILEQLTINTPAGSEAEPLQYTVELGFEIPAGNNYSLVASSSPKMIRETSAYHTGFPYALGDVGVVTQGMLQDTPTANNSTTYYFFYNWNFSVYEDCLSDRVKASIIVNEIPNPPAGAGEQTFSPGSTLKDLDVQGLNLRWYADKNGMEPLDENTPLVDGASYYVSQTIAGCESEFLKITVRLATGVDDHTQASFSVYPNPVNDILYVSGNQPLKYEIYSVQGRLALKGDFNQNAIDVQSLEPGVYLLHITGGENLIIKRFVKQ